MKKILVVEGNTKENNLELISNNIETHTQSIHNSLKKLNSNLELDQFDPSIKDNSNKLDLDKYDGLILAVPHNEFREFNNKEFFKKVMNINSIVYDVKSFFDYELVDERF